MLLQPLKNNFRQLIYLTRPGPKVWQANYHDRIVRDISHINRIRFDIANNPRKWKAKHDPPTTWNQLP